jgi:hypothetical protein
MAHVGRRFTRQPLRLVLGFCAALMTLTTFVAGGEASAAVTAAPESLHARVISLRPGLAPYNPQFASAGVRVEEVAFGFRSVAPDHFSCTVVVSHSGKIVGHTQSSFSGPWPAPPPRMRWGVQVEVKGGHTFKGIPSDASVKCRS